MVLSFLRGIVCPKVKIPHIHSFKYADSNWGIQSAWCSLEAYAVKAQGPLIWVSVFSVQVQGVPWLNKIVFLSSIPQRLWGFTSHQSLKVLFGSSIVTGLQWISWRRKSWMRISHSYLQRNCHCLATASLMSFIKNLDRILHHSVNIMLVVYGVPMVVQNFVH